MPRIAFLPLLALLFMLPAHAAPPIPCIADLDEIARFLPENDAGAGAHLAHHGALIATAFDTARAAAAQAPDVVECHTILRAYLRVWRPAHLGLRPAPVAAASADAVPAPAGADPLAPQLRVLGKDSVLLVLPSFGDRYGAAIGKLLTEHRAELLARKHWIIDVRGNDGGSDSSYGQLKGWLLDGPVYHHAVEYRVTPANIQAQLDVCAYAGDAASCARDLAPIVAQMRAAPGGSWVLIGGKRTRSSPVTLEPQRPARVAILTDRRCASSCEQFVLEARTGFRVKVVGRPTMGALDYSNMRPYKLPSGRTLFYTTTRSTRLPDMHVDAGGLAPDLLLPAPQDAAGQDAEVQRVQRWLEHGVMEWGSDRNP